MELDRLGATLKQVEEYNEAMKGEIAVTRRAAYAAEEAVQKLEKAKMEQDFRCGWGPTRREPLGSDQGQAGRGRVKGAASMEQDFRGAHIVRVRPGQTRTGWGPGLQVRGSVALTPRLLLGSNQGQSG